MQVVFLGGASQVGASCLAVQIGEQWVVVDAGVRVGGRGDPLPDLAFLQDKIVAAVLVTHAHADHIGALPLVHAAFPAAPIYATHATCLLMEVMLSDALKIMAKRATEEFEVPLYTEAQVRSTLDALRPLPVGQPFASPEVPDLTLTATLAGHVAGAVCLSFEHPEGRLVISGDISLTTQRTVAGASIPPLKRPDLLVLESTYGRSALHPNRQAEEVRLAEMVATVLAGGGHCLIPAFALGRAQEILLILLAAQNAKQIPRFPLVVDGLVRRVTAAYAQIPEVLNPKLASAIRRGRYPFMSANIEAVRDVAHRERILAGPPACILSSSGMLTGGPSAWYAERLVSQERAAILLTGYQDEESPGKRLLALAEAHGGLLRIGEQDLPVRCQVQRYALSAHADAGELANFVSALAPKAVALVHGDGEARAALGAQLEQTTVHLPQEGDHLDVQGVRRQRSGKIAALVQPLPRGIGGGSDPIEADLRDLHALLGERDPERVSITLRELAQIWYPHPDEEREDALRQLVAQLSQFFVPVTDLPGVYRLITPEENETIGPTPDLVRQILLVELQPGHLEPLVCLEVRPSGIHGLTPRGARGWTRFLPQSVLEILGPLPQDVRLDEAPEWLQELSAAATKFRKRTTRADLLAVLEPHVSYGLEEVVAWVGALPEDLSERLAIAHMLNDTPGLVRSEPRWEIGGPARYSLHPDQVVASKVRSSPHANTAALNALIDSMLGDAEGLYKRSFDPHTGDITLAFTFPDRARVRYATEIAHLAEVAGVQVSLSPQVHQGALAELGLRLLPEGIRAERQPSVLVEQRTLQIRCTGHAEDDAIAQAQAAFAEQAGWYLHLVLPAPPAPVVPPTPVVSSSLPTIVPEPLPRDLVSAPRSQPLEKEEIIALSRSYIPDTLGVTGRHVLPDGHLRLDSEWPDAARARWANRLELLQEAIGCPVEVGGKVNQMRLTQLVRSLAPREVRVAKSISIHTEEHRVVVRFEGTSDAAIWEAPRRALYEQTGWDLQAEMLASPTVTPRATTQGRLSQDAAIVYVKAQLGPETGLYKVGAKMAQGQLVLRFHFPDRARLALAETFQAIEVATGWGITVHPLANQESLERVARELLQPLGAAVQVSRVAIHTDDHQVEIVYQGHLTLEQHSQIETDFVERTAWQITWQRL